MSTGLWLHCLRVSPGHPRLLLAGVAGVSGLLPSASTFLWPSSIACLFHRRTARVGDINFLNTEKNTGGGQLAGMKLQRLSPCLACLFTLVYFMSLLSFCVILICIAGSVTSESSPRFYVGISLINLEIVLFIQSFSKYLSAFKRPNSVLDVGDTGVDHLYSGAVTFRRLMSSAFPLT